MEAGHAGDTTVLGDAATGKLQDLTDALQALQKIQDAFLSVVAKSELEEARGRRCILQVTGLPKGHQFYYFEVSGAGIRMVDAYTNYNTYVSAPIDTVLRVLSGLIYGWESCFASEWARGDARIVGARHFHDGVVFSDSFKRFAKLVRAFTGEVSCKVCGNKFSKGLKSCLSCGAAL